MEPTGALAIVGVALLAAIVLAVTLGRKAGALRADLLRFRPIQDVEAHVRTEMAALESRKGEHFREVEEHTAKQRAELERLRGQTEADVHARRAELQTIVSEVESAKLARATAQRSLAALRRE